MPNGLDEVTGPSDPAGQEIRVITKQLPATIGLGTVIFEISIWVVGILVAFGIGLAATRQVGFALVIAVLGVIPGLIFQLQKTQAAAYLRKLEQTIQEAASQVDILLEQRVRIMQNLASLVEKSIDLDKDVMKSVAAFRAGAPAAGDGARVATSSALEGILSQIRVAFEAYPQLQAQGNIAEAMRQNALNQKEITSASILYNDLVATWNRNIFDWPTRAIMATKAGYTTRIPFAASTELKETARGNFFA
jgi:LemA protein